MFEESFYNALRYVNVNSKFVIINHYKIDGFVKNYTSTDSSHWSELYPLDYKRQQKDEDELDFLFLIGSQAFCFWGYPKKWTIKYKGKILDGWWALVACLKKALEEGLPILEGEYLAQLTLSQTKKLFRGAPEIPLINKRKEILNKIGKKLVEKYQGRFHNFFIKENKEAFSLVKKISKEFYGFDDTSIYKGRKIFFYKKAQVVVSDIRIIINGRGYWKIENIEKLPGHADYKIPAILRNLGILEYNSELSKKVDNREELKADSEMEIEVRANMLYALHLISEKLKISPTTLSGILWSQGQIKNSLNKPYHLTKTIYY